MSTQIVERSAALPKSVARKALPGYSVGWAATLLVTDVVLFVFASWVGALIGFHRWGSPRIVGHLLIATAIFVLIWVLIFDRLGLYRRTYALSMKDELYYTAAALLLGTIPQLILFTIRPDISTSRVALACALVFSVALVGSSRALLHSVRQKQWFAVPRRVGIVGTQQRVKQVLDELDLADNSKVLQIVVDDLAHAKVDMSDDPALARIEWFNQARRWGSEALILTEMVPPAFLTRILEIAAQERMRLAVAPPVVRQCYDFSLETEGRQVLLVPSRARACSPRAQLFKRAMDLCFASVALLLFAPFMLLAAIATVLDSGWPILYRQPRTGCGGKVFSILKFRSMGTNAEREVGAVWASEKDPRRTRIGAILRRFSIDEMPQLFNVLKGEMSLVGPRPERPIFVDLFRGTLARYDDRHLVRPGITGWAQLHMKRCLDTSAVGEKLAYDLQYVENWSPFLDVAILFQTFCEFLFHRAA